MILSIDLGTSKLCAAVVDPETAELVAIRSCPNDSDTPGLLGDVHEQDPVRTWELCRGLMTQVLCDPGVAGRAVRAIAISGQMHGVLLVDRELRPLTNLMTWRDRRTARADGPGGITESLGLLGEGVQQRTGCQLGVGYGGATLRWLHANGQLPAGSMGLTVAGYVAAMLTGVQSIEETHAASWGIFDLTRSEWDRECAERLGIPAEVLPEVRRSAEPLGELRRGLCQALGVNGSPVVCSPVGDAQASIVGAAGFSTDSIVLNLGTGGQVSVLRPDYVYNDELDAWPMPFGTFAQVGAALCGGWSYAYLRRFFQSVAREVCGVEMSDAEVYERMNTLAASAPSGAAGLVVDTRFSGTRKDESVRGAISGIDTTNLTPANLSLGVLEGTVRELHSMWLASGVTGASRLVASGNAVRMNPVLRTVIRRAFDTPCFMSAVPEEACRGAGYAAAVGAGIATPEAITATVARFAEEF